MDCIGDLESKPNQATSANVVDDPLGQQGRVLTFLENQNKGDAFLPILHSVSSHYIVSFKFLGMKAEGAVSTGAFVGMVYDKDGQDW